MEFSSSKAEPSLKFAIWLYFWLLLFEGVLRKWVLPSWSDLLFIIRDPLVLVIYMLALRSRLFPARPAMLTLWIIAILSLAFAVTANSPFIVTAFGLRTNYLHLPLVFVMERALDRSDVLRFGRWTILTSVPILVLMIVQFNSPVNAWVNVGVGGSESGQLRGAMGRIRPPGPFSFISGVVSFFGLLMAFVVYGWVHRHVFRWFMVLIGSATVLCAVPVSISRSLAFVLLVVAMFGLVVAARDVRRIPGYLGPLAVVVAVVLFAADTIYVQAFVTRWEESVEAGGAGFYSNVVERSLEQFTKPFELAADTPIFGHGIGLGTVAGARLMTGQYTFLLSESELARLVLELGPLLGFAFVAWRAWLSGLIVFGGWSKFRADGDALAWLLAGSSFLSVLSGQWGPATNLGFAVFGAGLSLAARNDPEPDESGEAVDVETTGADDNDE